MFRMSNNTRRKGGNRFLGRTSGPMIFIAHRGNIDGPNPSEENDPAYLLRALSMGFDVEIDAWLDPATERWALGHDGPDHPVEYDFLLTAGFWVHAKNTPALRAMARDPRVHCFAHDVDEYTLTSRGYIWAYPEVELAGPKCVAVMYSNPERLSNQGNKIGGICHDIVGPLRDKYISSRKLDYRVFSIERKIRLVVFNFENIVVDDAYSDNILETITALKRMGISRCIASNWNQSTVESFQTQTSRILNMDALYCSKGDAPYSTIYQEVCDEFGIDHGSTLVIGDPAAASSAGCHVLQVSDPDDAALSSVQLRIQELEALTECVIILILLSGPVSPLFVTKIGAKSVIETMVQSLSTRRYDVKYIFVVEENVADAFDIDTLCSEAVKYAPLNIVKINPYAVGSIHTILSRHIPDNTPLLVADGLHIPVWNDGQSLDDILGTHADSAMAVVQSIDPRFHYAHLNTTITSKHGPNCVADITMGGPSPSNLACSGLYYFKQASYFKKAANSFIPPDEHLGHVDAAKIFGEMANENLEVEALHLKYCWPLRNTEEIRNYERFSVSSK